MVFISSFPYNVFYSHANGAVGRNILIWYCKSSQEHRDDIKLIMLETEYHQERIKKWDSEASMHILEVNLHKWFTTTFINFNFN